MSSKIKKKTHRQVEPTTRSSRSRGLPDTETSPPPPTEAEETPARPPPAPPRPPPPAPPRPPPPPPPLPPRRAPPRQEADARDQLEEGRRHQRRDHQRTAMAAEEAAALKANIEAIVKQQMEEERAGMDDERRAIRQERDAMRIELETLQKKLVETAEQREGKATDALEMMSKQWQHMNLEGQKDMRKPTPFSQPTLSNPTEKFFKDYERYIKLWKPKSAKAPAVYLPTCLSGAALTCYDRQATDTKDDYVMMKKEITDFFQEQQEDLELQTLQPFDSSKQTMNEYLQEAKDFFTAKGIPEKQSLQDLKMCLKGDLQSALMVHKPKTWVEAGKWLRYTYNLTKPCSVQAVMEATPALLDSFSEPLTTRLAAIEEEIKNARESRQESVAAMGGSRPQFHKQPSAPTNQTGKYPPLPIGHVINKNYTGRPEDYDPTFLDKVKARKAAAKAEAARKAAAAPQPPTQPQYAQQQQQMQYAGPPPMHQQYQYHNPYYNPYYQQPPWPQFQPTPQGSSTGQRAPAAGTTAAPAHPQLIWPYPHPHQPPPMLPTQPQGN